MQLQLEPASSNILPANGGGVITQVIKATNNMHGQVHLCSLASSQDTHVFSLELLADS
jgi:hypothetical protein